MKEGLRMKRNRQIRLLCANKIAIGSHGACPQTCESFGDSGSFCAEVLAEADKGIPYKGGYIYIQEIIGERTYRTRETRCLHREASRLLA